MPDEFDDDSIRRAAAGADQLTSSMSNATTTIEYASTAAENLSMQLDRMQKIQEAISKNVAIQTKDLAAQKAGKKAEVKYLKELVKLQKEYNKEIAKASGEQKKAQRERKKEREKEKKERKDKAEERKKEAEERKKREKSVVRRAGKYLRRNWGPGQVAAQAKAVTGLSLSLGGLLALILRIANAQKLIYGHGRKAAAQFGLRPGAGAPKHMASAVGSVFGKFYATPEKAGGFVSQLPRFGLTGKELTKREKPEEVLKKDYWTYTRFKGTPETRAQRKQIEEGYGAIARGAEQELGFKRGKGEKTLDFLTRVYPEAAENMKKEIDTVNQADAAAADESYARYKKVATKKLNIWKREVNVVDQLYALVEGMNVPMETAGGLMATLSRNFGMQTDQAITLVGVTSQIAEKFKGIDLTAAEILGDWKAMIDAAGTYRVDVLEIQALYNSILRTQKATTFFEGMSTDVKRDIAASVATINETMDIGWKAFFGQSDAAKKVFAEVNKESADKLGLFKASGMGGLAGAFLPTNIADISPRSQTPFAAALSYERLAETPGGLGKQFSIVANTLKQIAPSQDKDEMIGFFRYSLPSIFPKLQESSIKELSDRMANLTGDELSAAMDEMGKNIQEELKARQEAEANWPKDRKKLVDNVASIAVATLTFEEWIRKSIRRFEPLIKGVRALTDAIDRLVKWLDRTEEEQRRVDATDRAKDVTGLPVTPKALKIFQSTKPPGEGMNEVRRLINESNLPPKVKKIMSSMSLPEIQNLFKYYQKTGRAPNVLESGVRSAFGVETHRDLIRKIATHVSEIKAVGSAQDLAKLFYKEETLLTGDKRMVARDRAVFVRDAMKQFKLSKAIADQIYTANLPVMNKFMSEVKATPLPGGGIAKQDLGPSR